MTAPIASTTELLTRAYAMEVEAAERYEDFAAQMELHGNPDVAGLFRKLSGIERLHAEAMAEDLAQRGVAITPRPALAAPGQEGLETAPGDDLHYLMTPHHALEIALANEERAVAFFADLADSAVPEELRRLAAEFAREEKEHVELVRQWLARLPEPSADWAYDPDEPRMPD